MNRKLIGYIAVGVGCLVLQSCFVAKEYKRPESNNLENLYRTDRLADDSISIAAISWRQFFSDTLLTGYIEEGLQNNLDIRIALQRLVAADAYRKQGKTGYLPAIQGRASLTNHELSANCQFGSFFSGSIEQFELSANFSWEADIWGTIRSNRRATLAEYLQQKASHTAVKTLLVAQVASSYFQLLALDAQYDLTSETIDNRQASLETIKALKDAGNVTQVAVDQTAAQLYNSQALLVDIEARIFLEENMLSYLLGKPGTQVERGRLQSQPVPEEPQLGVPAMLLRNRPDVIAAEYALINAFELTNVARSNFYPSFSLTGTGGLQSLQFKSWFDSGSLFANLVASLAQPIFNRRQVRTQYEVAMAAREESLINFQKSLLLASLEVSNALYEFKTETRKFEFRRQEAEALRRAEVHSEALLKNGFGTYLDLLTARQNALSAELNAIDNRLQQMLTIIALYRALGGGWQ
jgi:NodT family efflux transporter outer membrane factor (OMF) lipoprotein